MIASRAFESSDVKARGAGGDPCQHRYCFALWTRWPVKRDHDAVPCIRRERNTLSHRYVPIRGGDGTSMPLRVRSCWSIQLTSQIDHRTARFKFEDNCPQMAVITRPRDLSPMLRIVVGGAWTPDESNAAHRAALGLLNGNKTRRIVRRVSNRKGRTRK